MRQQVKICGETFEVERIEGGRLQATNNAKYPGFAAFAACHAELRRKLPAAFANWQARRAKAAAEYASDLAQQQAVIPKGFNRVHPALRARADASILQSMYGSVGA